ncbi:MAG: hypothetical protein Q4P07_02440 [Ornithinimicrobium sp.]|uniref:hypothetical protein n=1 Tax=Ornithinimicrobium sp. TaxID=1977084 RepID=UPI0026DFF374|nr:hypothetical protein [Ornithinimicrobium sp.]MDO5738986.1 hypothetical protein [Ornithinimicrobium sp.]
MSKKMSLVYALIGLGLVIWWALTQSSIPVALLLVLLVVLAVHIVRHTRSERERKHDIDEADARAGFPSPPERSL